MDQLIFASLSYTHYWYEVGMLKVPADLVFWAGGSDEQLPAIEGRGCRKFVPVLGGDGTKIVPPGDIFDQPPGEMS